MAWYSLSPLVPLLWRIVLVDWEVLQISQEMFFCFLKRFSSVTRKPKRQPSWLHWYHCCSWCRRLSIRIWIILKSSLSVRRLPKKSCGGIGFWHDLSGQMIQGVTSCSFTLTLMYWLKQPTQEATLPQQLMVIFWPSRTLSSNGMRQMLHSSIWLVLVLLILSSMWRMCTRGASSPAAGSEESMSCVPDERRPKGNLPSEVLRKLSSSESE
mmetsp:Transcript_212/g.415  ORF Transcript_212/g.415 Transcript_212/m.415 type:complete len:211 (+) Transcript_212:554-1186(+)